MVGDNHSSHFSPAIIEACRKNNIVFVCLPPNSTHLMQPLDVAGFSSLKAAWRSELLAFKLKHPRETCKYYRYRYEGKKLK